MGSTTSTTAQTLTSELQLNGVTIDPSLQQTLESFIEHRTLEEEKLARSRAILLIKQLDGEKKDEKMAVELSRLTSKVISVWFISSRSVVSYQHVDVCTGAE